MDNVLDKKKKLIKQKRIINLLLFPCWVLSFYISISTLAYVYPIIEIMTIIIKMDNVEREMLLSFVEFFYKFLPMMVYIGGNVIDHKLCKDIKEIDECLENGSIIEKELVKIDDSECKIIDEQEILKTYDILERFVKLPRGKQMELLNYIKGDLQSGDKEMTCDINKLNSKYREILQTEFEDILFPDYECDNDTYVRIRKKDSK